MTMRKKMLSEVRSSRHRFAAETWKRIMTRQDCPASLRPETWFAQMVVATLPANTDIASFKKRLTMNIELKSH